MPTDLQQLVKAELKGMSAYGGAPVTLQRETEALCAVLGRKLAALASDIASLRASLDEQIKENCADYAAVADTITGHAFRLGHVERTLSRVYTADHAE